MASTSSLTIEKAFNKLKGSLSPQDEQDFLSITLKDVRNAAVAIEQDQAARKAMKNVRRIQPFLDTMESYSKVIEVFCQGYPPMAFVWGPMKLMLQLSSQYIQVFDKLLDTYRDIANVVPRIDRLRAIFGDSEDFRRSLSLVYVDILDFHQRAYKIFRRRSWHLMFAVSWGMFEHRIQTILNNLEKHTDNVDKEAAALHFEHMKEARERAERDANDYERRRQNAMVHEVLGWLSADEDRQDETLQRLSDSRQPETCDWIKSKPKFQTWCGGDADSRLIWVQGKPGSGKTILSSFIIEHLKCKEQQVTVSYYFCNHRMGDRDTVSNILCTSAVQILRQHPDIVPVVHSEYYEKWSGKASRAMKKMLKDILAGVSCARLVIDGLDECTPEVQKELPKVLVDIHETVGKSFKILICSRLAADPKAMILLRGETDNAIKLYVKNEVRDLCNEVEFVPDEDAKWIENRLALKADGMFLWVRLVVSDLRDQGSLGTFREAVDKLPNGLNEAYDRILTNIERNQSPTLRDHAHRILRWVACARRPLRACEVQCGLSLRPGHTRIDAVSQFRKPILDICGPILEERNGDIIEIVHFSAKEYLLHECSGPFIQPSAAHFDIAFSCTALLASFHPKFPIGDNEQAESSLNACFIQGFFALFAYASQFWAYHVQAYLHHCRDPGSESFIHLITELMTLSSVYKDQIILLRPTDTTISTSNSHMQDTIANIPHLSSQPILQVFLRDVAQFQHLDAQKQHTFQTLKAYQEWRENADPTILSGSEARVRTIVKNLYSNNVTNLPGYISAQDIRQFHDVYVRPFLACRILDCQRSVDGFKSFNDLEEHEAGHRRQFTCSKCDFSARGFPSRRALKDHIQRHHMQAEDFVVPPTIHQPDHRDHRNQNSYHEMPIGDLNASFGEDFSGLETSDVIEEILQEQGKHSQSSEENEDIRRQDYLTQLMLLEQQNKRRLLCVA